MGIESTLLRVRDERGDNDRLLKETGLAVGDEEMVVRPSCGEEERDLRPWETGTTGLTAALDGRDVSRTDGR